MITQLERQVMKPKKVDEIPIDDKYIYELKYDGGSAIISKNTYYNGVYIAHSNNADNQVYKYPELAVALSDLPPGEYIAELCVITKDHPGGIINTFQKRQCSNRFRIMQRAKQFPITAVIYDITRDGNHSIETDLLSRKKLLEKKIKPSENVILADYYHSPDALLKMKDNIEGMVIKDIDAPYRFNKRDRWFKYRFNKEETVKFTTYEKWERKNPDGAVSSGIVLSTDEGHRVNLPGIRCETAMQKINEKGYVNCEVSYYSKSKDGFRFATIKRVL